MNLPSISIITNSYNSDLSIFDLSLKSIREQNYPKSLIEHIVMDAGSNNGTADLARSYNCMVINCPDLIMEHQQRMGLAIKRAKNDIVLMLETDNILVGRNWLKDMVLPFMYDEEIFCTFSMHNNFLKNMSLLTKYCALIGASDPPVCYLGKADKMMLDEKKYNKGEIISETPKYYIVRFTKENLPTLGDNGHMVRRAIINNVNKDLKKFHHTDAFFYLVVKGHNKFGVVKNSVIHYIGSSILKLYRRRVFYRSQFRGGKRAYLIFDYNSTSDKWNLFKYMIFSITFVVPFLRALKGYMRIHEPAWFLHPVVCFVAVVMYTKSEILYLIRKVIRKSFYRDKRDI